MRKICMILALLLALCTCALAETQAPAISREDLIGLWNMEYVTADGFMVSAQSYGLSVTLDLREDGSAALDFGGEAGEPMQWYMQDGRAFIAGYNPDADVELIIDENGVLEISDEIGAMFLTRAEQEAE